MEWGRRAMRDHDRRGGHAGIRLVAVLCVLALTVALWSIRGGLETGLQVQGLPRDDGASREPGLQIPDPVAARVEVPVRESPGVSFYNLADGVALRGDGELRLAVGEHREIRCSVVDGRVERPAELESSAEFFVVGLEVAGESYTYLDLNSTWEHLAGQSPVPVFPGVPQPALAIGDDEVALRTPVRIRSPQNGSIRVGAPEYRGVDSVVSNPFALPYIGGRHHLDVESVGLWGRFMVERPLATKPGPPEFQRLLLRRLVDVPVVLRSMVPVNSLTFTMSPIAPSLTEGPPEASGFSVDLQGSEWAEGLDGVRSLSLVATGLTRGRYRAGFLQMGEEQGLFVSPHEVDIRGEALEFWIEHSGAPQAGAGEIHLRFSRSRGELFSLGLPQFRGSLVATEAGQIVGGQPNVVNFLISPADIDWSDEFTAVLRRAGGLVAGSYDLWVRPLGIHARVEVPAAAESVVIELPRVGLVEVRPAATQRLEGPLGASIGFPRLEPVGQPIRTGVATSVSSLGHADGAERYLLGYGRYRLADRSGQGFIDPEFIDLASDDAVIEFEWRAGSSCVLTWHVGGQPTGIPLSVLAAVEVQSNGEVVEGAVVQAHGYALASGAMTGLKVTVRESGNYDLRMHLVDPDGGRRLVRVDGVDMTPEGGAPVAVELLE